ncbi:MAG: hypothetical protein M0Z94_06395 [Dehalococcoidales bacterium]|nr:hypothetical protein [Dehalococcoidales bacterium]
MSEYQYYEFLAMDRALTKEQMAELRALSSRASITPSRFQNVYNYGDFKGDPEVLMEKYFDAFVYVANWGTHWLMLRLPKNLLAGDVASPYINDEQLAMWVKGENVILSFRLENEDGEWEEGEEWMPQLASLRAELAAGDLRALYIGWLSSIQDLWLEDDEEDEDDPSGESGQLADEVEPPVPPGLAHLSGAQEALVDFLEVDRDLLAVAAERSAPLASGLSRSDWARWLRELPEGEKDALLLRLVVDGDTHVKAELTHCLQRTKAGADGTTAGVLARGRTVRELLKAAEEQAERQRHEEAVRAAEERERQEREAARERARHLDGLVGREAELWRSVETLVEAKKAREYDLAVQQLRDLRDLAVRADKMNEFAARLADLRIRHARKPTFLQRLDKANLAGPTGGAYLLNPCS